MRKNDSRRLYVARLLGVTPTFGLHMSPSRRVQCADMPSPPLQKRGVPRGGRRAQCAQRDVTQQSAAAKMA